MHNLDWRVILSGVLRDPLCVVRFLKDGDVSSFSLSTISKYVLSSKPLVIEAGVYDGKDSLRILDRWPDCTLYGFEPHPEMYLRATENLSRHRGVTLIRAALIEDPSASEVGLYAGVDDSGTPHASSSILPPAGHLDVFPDIQFEENLVVSATTLGKLCNDYSIDQVDLLWLDLQGAELGALRGADSALKLVETIYVEVSRTALYDGACTLQEIRSFLEANGFRMRKLRLPFHFGNAIFTRA
jgi:FkbM family methyltransferase